MKKYRDISRVKLGFGYLPAVAIGSIIYFMGERADNFWLAWAGLITLVVLIVVTTLVWRKVLALGGKG